MSDLLVGCCGFGDNRRSYLRRLRVIEVQETFFMPPRAATLRRWRDEAPDRFVFCIRAWQLITHEPGRGGYPRLAKSLELDRSGGGYFRDTPTVTAALAATLEAAASLRAEAILFETPASFTPTPAHQQSITRFFEAAPRDGATPAFVWHPRGVWPRRRIVDIARDVGIIATTDPVADGPPEGLLYARLEAASYSDEALLAIAEACLQSERARCVFNTQHMVRDALRLQAMLSDEVYAEDDDADDDLDDDLDDEASTTGRL